MRLGSSQRQQPLSESLFEMASMGTLAVSCSTSSAPEPHCLLAFGGSVGLVTCAEHNGRLDTWDAVSDLIAEVVVEALFYALARLLVAVADGVTKLLSLGRRAVRRWSQ